MGFDTIEINLVQINNYLSPELVEFEHFEENNTKIHIGMLLLVHDNHMCYCEQFFCQTVSKSIDRKNHNEEYYILNCLGDLWF